MDTTGSQVPPDDRFEVVRRIARGGAGTVWLARDRTLERDVALKQVEIPEGLPSDERDRTEQRVLREAQAAARMAHPGVVAIYDVLGGDDVVDLVMEFVESPTLRDTVEREGPLDEGTVAELGLGLLEVLEHAHGHGVVHRDIKPANVFLHADGRVQVADFGIASVAGETTLTHTGTALGSPDFIAPEQAQGARAAPAADVWGLGATLYFAVEGMAPFTRSGPIPTLRAVVHEERRAYHRAQQLPPVLDALLRKEPASRPALHEVRSALERIVAGDAIGDAIAAPPAAGPGEAAAGGADTPGDADGPAALQEQGATGDGDRRRPGRVAAALVAVVALAGAVAWLTTDTDPLGGGLAEGPGQGSDAPQDQRVDDADAAHDEEFEEPSPPPDSPLEGSEPGEAGQPTMPEADRVPDDWRTEVGPTYRVAVPATWQPREASGNRTDFAAPDSGAYLRVDHTSDPAPDPLADWQAAADDFAARHDDYEELRLERVTYRDFDAAVWEYRYREGDVALRALNLNLVDGDHAYALNLQSPQDEWDEIGRHLPHVTAGFSPDR